MKNLTILIAFLITIQSFSQEKKLYTFGDISREELALNIYDKDTTANAVVLFESGNTVFKVKGAIIIIQTTYYHKIKIFNKEGFDHASFSISLYNNKKRKEYAEKIKAITHNGLNKTVLLKSNIFENRVNENWRKIDFTMPNLKEGSIIEVEYVLETPFKFNLTGWNFQSDIPKIESRYDASIPGVFHYNRKLIGYLRLNTNNAYLKKKCFSVSGYGGDADCENISYSMKNVPAFEEEEYMTDSDNFKASIKFELTKTIWFDGTKKNYTTTWNAVDKEFRTDKNIGGQLKKMNFFEDKLPPEIKNMETDLEKAKAVYQFIQNHFTWNEKYSIFKNVRVKNAFEDKTGNVGEINISLINALKSVGLNAELVLISTRNNGFPTKKYPVLSDFNYLIAKLNINSKSYLLDATEKLSPFGLLPYRCLNHYGRVMDFENESYWFDIEPKNNSKSQLVAKLDMDEDGNITGTLKIISYGYDAFFRREELSNMTEDELFSDFESEFDNVEAISYNVEYEDDTDKPLVENVEISIENFENSNTIYLNPFFTEALSKNPFKQENRLYPVDFGYPRKYVVNFMMELPDNYSVQSNPKSKSVKLEEDGGYYKLLVRNQGNVKIILNSSLILSKPVFYNFEYISLKTLFRHVINAHKTPIILKKK